MVETKMIDYNKLNNDCVICGKGKSNSLKKPHKNNIKGSIIKIDKHHVIWARLPTWEGENSQLRSNKLSLTLPLCRECHDLIHTWETNGCLQEHISLSLYESEDSEKKREIIKSRESFIDSVFTDAIRSSWTVYTNYSEYIGKEYFIVCASRCGVGDLNETLKNEREIRGMSESYARNIAEVKMLDYLTAPNLPGKDYINENCPAVTWHKKHILSYVEYYSGKKGPTLKQIEKACKYHCPDKSLNIRDEDYRKRVFDVAIRMLDSDEIRIYLDDKRNIRLNTPKD